MTRICARKRYAWSSPTWCWGAIAACWAVLILRTKFPAIQSEHEEGGDHGRVRDLLRYPHFLWAVGAQFMYVGAQVGTWSYFIKYVPGLHAPARESSRIFPDRYAGGFRRGTLHLGLPDALRRPQ
jgi:FHS family L-fucose permease-like MFS transporter